MDRFYRRAARLDHYDYANEGAYFVTLAVDRQLCVLGKAEDGTVELSKMGAIVAETWDALPDLFPSVELDAFVVMPNHIHGILVITDYQNGSPPSSASRRRATTLPTIMRAFKSLTAVASSQVLERDSVRFWQHGFDEYLLRDADDLAYLRDYIARNPAEWLEDEAYPG